VNHHDAIRVRRSRGAQVQAFFIEHLGKRFGTMELHGRFGTSFRARVSEINRNPSLPISILNKTTVAKDSSGQPCERSVYWAELRTESDYMRRHREEQEQAAPLFAGVHG
jgi:hypothetical protein